jgi:hypothetical protein
MDDKATWTIRDFVEQRPAYPDHSGYYGASDLFADVRGPLPAEITVTAARADRITNAQDDMASRGRRR